MTVLLTIFIVGHRIEGFFGESSKQVGSYPLKSTHRQPAQILSGLTIFLRQCGDIGSCKVNFVLDERLLDYRYIKLPLTNKGKVVKILEFELGNLMLYEVERYNYDYTLRANKEESFTEIGVYAIQKEFFNGLLQVCKEFNLEVQWILPYNNLIDVRNKIKNSPGNALYLQIEMDCAKMFVYRDGFLVDYSAIGNPTEVADRAAPECFRGYIALINQRITACRLAHREIKAVSVNAESAPLVRVDANSRLELFAEGKSEVTLPEIDPRSFLDIYLNGSLQRINLLKSSFPLIKELKKNYRKAVVSFCILVASLSVYLASFAFHLYRQNLEYEKLDREYSAMVNRYLPKGTSKSNAVVVLRERVEKLEERQIRNSKYATRKYPVTGLIQKISLMKRRVASLHVDKIQTGEKSATIYGRVTSIQDFDNFLRQIAATFPKEQFDTKNNHKTQGDSLIAFTTTIRPKKHFP